MMDRFPAVPNTPMNADLVEIRTNLECACRERTLQEIGTVTDDESAN
jgi:hypothetical protein